VPSHSMIDVTANGFKHADGVYVLEQDIPRWIPVGERLPDFDVEVLVGNPYCYVTAATRKKLDRYSACRADDGLPPDWEWIDSWAMEPDVAPTHWMPLLPLPAPREATT